MEEKRFECLMMLQIHRSDTHSRILMQLLTDLPPLQHGDLTFNKKNIYMYMYQCTMYSAIDSFFK